MIWKKAGIVAGLMVLGLAFGYLVFADCQGFFLDLPAFWGQKVSTPRGVAVAFTERLTGFWLSGLAGLILGVMVMFFVGPMLERPHPPDESHMLQKKPSPGGNGGRTSEAAGSGDHLPVHGILRPVLRGICGEYAGAVFPLEREIVIGRDPQVSSVVIDEARISRRHCTIRFEKQKGVFLVTDCSTGGTFLQPGNSRLPKGVPTSVPSGASISFNASACRFELVHLQESAVRTINSW